MIEKIKEGLFVKKEWYGYRVVYPIKKDLTKPATKENINWKHVFIGDWGNFINISIFVVLLLFLAWAYNHDTQECRDLIENPEAYCSNFNSDPVILPINPAYDHLNITLKDGEL